MSKTDKILYVLLALGFVILSFTVLALSKQTERIIEKETITQVEKEQLGGLSRLQPTYLNQNSATNSRTSIFPAFDNVGTNATTTFPFNISNAELYDWNILALSTSTSGAPQFIYKWEFSNDCTSTTGWSNCTWFGESGNTVTNNTIITEGIIPLHHYWATATSGLQTRNMQVPQTAARSARLSIQTNATTTVWIEAVPKVIQQ